MVGTLTKQKIKEVVRSSIMLLFQHSVQFKVNLNVEALIGVTLDEKDCFIISINETVDKASIGRRSQGQLANERNISSETAIGDYIPARPHIKKKKKRDARSPGGSSRQKKSRSESGENQFGDSEDTPINVNSPRDIEPDGGSGDADENVSNELESENNKSALDPVRLCTTYNNTNSIDTDSDHTVNYDIPASTSIGSIENTNTDSNTSNADRIGATLNPPCDRDDVVMIKSENDDSNTGLPIDQDAHIPQPIPASSWHTPQGSDGGPLMSGAGYPETKVPQNQVVIKPEVRDDWSPSPDYLDQQEVSSWDSTSPGGSSSRLYCPICRRIFSSQGELAQHMTWHQGKFVCPKCGQGFNIITEYVFHMANHPIRE